MWFAENSGCSLLFFLLLISSALKFASPHSLSSRVASQSPLPPGDLPDPQERSGDKNRIASSPSTPAVENTSDGHKKKESREADGASSPQLMMSLTEKSPSQRFKPGENTNEEEEINDGEDDMAPTDQVAEEDVSASSDEDSDAQTASKSGTQKEDQPRREKLSEKSEEEEDLDSPQIDEKEKIHKKQPTLAAREGRRLFLDLSAVNFIPQIVDKLKKGEIPVEEHVEGVKNLKVETQQVKVEPTVVRTGFLFPWFG